MNTQIDPSKIRTRLAFASLLTLTFEALFILWFTNASTAAERIVAGILSAVVLLSFLIIVFDSKILSKPDLVILTKAKKLVGKWQVTSRSRTGLISTGIMHIARDGNSLAIKCDLYLDEKLLGNIHSSIVKVNENRLIYQYQMYVAPKAITMDAVSIMLFDPDAPETMNGNWIVASTSEAPHCGTIECKKIK